MNTAPEVNGRRPRLLDLFCGVGGCSVGYERAGFDVFGVDIAPQPNYPFPFAQADALEVLRGQKFWVRGNLMSSYWVLDGHFDAIHASPPCQAYSTATKHRDRHPDHVAATRELLEATGLPWAMENVPNAPMRWGITLCGGMFDMQVRRHRTFELSFMAFQPPHRCPVRPWEVTGHAGGHNRKSESHRKYRDTAHAKELMQMPWAQTSREVTEAIPPPYTEWIGARLLEQVAVAA